MNADVYNSPDGRTSAEPRRERRMEPWVSASFMCAEAMSPSGRIGIRRVHRAHPLGPRGDGNERKKPSRKSGPAFDGMWWTILGLNQ
ncbi:hypothetical protein [Microbispora hainanensis]|uniref:hypothetical protein n=1 Tax=Microbispora hainanensis TaxID=568844 RepID=UPI0032513254